MKKPTKRMILLALLAAMLFSLCACHQNPTQEQLYSKLFSHFESRGLACQLFPVEENRAVPIYRASAWNALMLGSEEVLVYFDDSNRADYLSTFVDEETFGPAWRFGLRFVLVYNGENEAVLNALNDIENV